MCPKHYCLSTVGVREDLFRRDPKTVPVTDFFGSLRPVELTLSVVNVSPVEKNRTKLPEPKVKYKYITPFPSEDEYM